MAYQREIRSAEISGVEAHRPGLTYDFFRFLRWPGDRLSISDLSEHQLGKAYRNIA